jgi:hypothetical protein
MSDHGYASFFMSSNGVIALAEKSYRRQNGKDKRNFVENGKKKSGNSKKPS